MSAGSTLFLNGESLALRVVEARTFFARLKGWLGKKQIAEDEALWIAPCARVHSLGMALPIAVVMISREGRVLSMEDFLQPWALGPPGLRGGAAVEMAQGAISRLGISVGDLLTLEGPSR